jgi:predicted phosphodiesterase
MVRKRKRRKRRRNSYANDFFRRITRAIVAVLVLTAFVLAIAFAVKQISSFNAKNLVGLISPYLARVGMGEEEVGKVAGEFIERFTDLGIGGISGLREKLESTKDENKAEDSTPDDQEANYQRPFPEGDVLFSMAVLADSHVANDKQEFVDNKVHLQLAMDKAKELVVDRMVHVGDITNWGVLGDLRETKQMMDSMEMDYSALPGDRDLAQSVGTDNFLKVFDEDSSSFEIEETKFVLLDNSANYTLISEETMNWFAEEVKNADFVILPQPLYTDGLVLFNYLYMGNSQEEPTSESLAQKQGVVRGQRDELLELIRESDVKAVIVGDHHKSSQITDGVRPSLEHYVVGAISGTVSVHAQSVIQTQRFSLLKVYENGMHTVEDVLLYNY